MINMAKAWISMDKSLLNPIIYDSLTMSYHDLSMFTVILLSPVFNHYPPLLDLDSLIVSLFFTHCITIVSRLFRHSSAITMWQLTQLTSRGILRGKWKWPTLWRSVGIGPRFCTSLAALNAWFMGRFDGDGCFVYHFLSLETLYVLSFDTLHVLSLNTWHCLSLKTWHQNVCP